MFVRSLTHFVTFDTQRAQSPGATLDPADVDPAPSAAEAEPEDCVAPALLRFKYVERGTREARTTSG